MTSINAISFFESLQQHQIRIKDKRREKRDLQRTSCSSLIAANRSALALIARAALQEVIKVKFMLIVDLALMSDFLELYLWARRHKSRLIHAAGTQTANSKSKAICPRDGHRSRGTQSSVMSAWPPIYIYLHLAHSASLRTGSEEGNGVSGEHKYSFINN